MLMKNLGGHSSGIENKGEFTYEWNFDGSVKTLIFRCQRLNRNCSINIRKGEPEQGTHTFGWNGDIDKPTITPSIGCDDYPRCGWHGNITNGEIMP